MANKKAESTTEADTGRPDILIIGDQYHEKVEFKSSNEHTWIEGGVWYVERVLEAGLATREGFTAPTIATCPVSPNTDESTMAELYIERRGRQAYLDDTYNVPRIAWTKYSEKSVKHFKNYFSQCPNKFLVIEDMDLGYRSDGKKEWNTVLEKWSDTASNPTYRSVRNITLLGRSLSNLRDDDPSLWGRLLNRHTAETLVIVNADLLRSMGAEISRRVSWERTAQDLIEFLHSDSEFARLARFSHLIVRFGITAAIHCFNPGHNIRYRLFYDTKCNNGYFRDVDEEGGIIGNNSVFAACILKELLKVDNGHSDDASTIAKGIESAIPACQRMHRLGYPDFPSNGEWLAGWPRHAVFDEAVYNSTRSTSQISDEKVIELEPTTEDLIDDVDVPRGVQNWSILNHATTGAALVDTARNVVLFGVEKAIDRSLHDNTTGIFIRDARIFAPKAKFNKLVTLDRDEIESFRGVFNIIHEYIRSKQQKPLSIAVFGPPGSGKSFSVEQIANACVSHLAGDAGGSKLEKRLNVNMSQVDTFGDLCEILEKHLGSFRTEGSNPDLDRIPFLFFDEFDCDHTGHLGWLKTFLSPMEDEFIPIEKGAKKLILSRSVMVFAGGTTTSYQDFSCEGLPPNDPNRLKFVGCKGPDFVSRLRGHIDIKGINPIDVSDRGYLIRRSILLRQYLKDNGFTHRLEHVDMASIDYGVFDAMLMVDSYKHGARSMRALVSMCMPLHRRIERASLPIDQLLNMHADADEFHSIIREYSHSKQHQIRMDHHILT